MNEDLVFNIIRKELGQQLDPIDISLIEELSNQGNYSLAVPQDTEVIKDFDFFKENQDSYHFVQLGEILSFKNLELDKPFMAYTKEPVSLCNMTEKCIREIVAYKPRIPA